MHIMITGRQGCIGEARYGEDDFNRSTGFWSSDPIAAFALNRLCEWLEKCLIRKGDMYYDEFEDAEGGQ